MLIANEYDDHSREYSYVNNRGQEDQEKDPHNRYCPNPVIRLLQERFKNWSQHSFLGQNPIKNSWKNVVSRSFDPRHGPNPNDLLNVYN